MNSENITAFSDALQSSAADYRVRLDRKSLETLSNYYQLLQTWNPRLHLVAPASPAEFATRHVLESLILLQHLDDNSAVADVGSGGGLPIIPCLIVRSRLKATLIESSQKKTVFLREALKVTKTSDRATVVNDRFENVATPAVDYVTCRAIERFETLIPKLIAWSPKSATLLLFGGDSLKKPLETAGLIFKRNLLPNSLRRFLFIARKSEELIF